MRHLTKESFKQMMSILWGKHAYVLLFSRSFLSSWVLFHGK